LNGSEGKYFKIADEYSGTNAGNLANYYADSLLKYRKVC
jgi:hypothetical protein